MTIKYTLLGLTTAGLAVLAVGCQQSSKHAEVEPEYPARPAMTSTYTEPSAQPAGYSTGTSASPFTVPYTVTGDSAYMTSPSATTSAGTLHSGDTVYLRSGTSLDSAATPNGYVAAKTSDGRLIYVRTADLRMK